jgi:ribulose 1,5-bisphosphate synthetase/thiazole synthase
MMLAKRWQTAARLLAALLMANLQATGAAEGDKPPAEVRADVVVYGGTPGGLIAAIAAAREGASVVVIEPSAWLGGMVTGGLARSDVGKQETIGGYTREFFTRAAARYGGEFLFQAEPHANMETFREMLREAKVEVVTKTALDRVAVANQRIESLTTTDGRRFFARQFIDASYEGDLLAAAGVSWRAGREARAEFNEPLAGFYPMPLRARSQEVMSSEAKGVGGTGPSYVHGTPAAISGVDAAGKPIAGVVADPGLKPGSADNLLQAYNFRLTVTQRPDLLVPFPKPANYDAARYELLMRMIAHYPGIRFARIFHPGPIANGKFDLNAQGLFSSDLPGGNQGYVEGDAATRARIRQDHIDFLQGLLWFLSHDERVPQRLRAETQSWGLCRDEFTDNQHWSYAMYVRAARRMVGEYVMVQRDCQLGLRKPDSIAMGSFLIDCHIVQRILHTDGTVRDEGAFPDTPTKPYEIPYRSITPKRSECENLLVPVCASASHIAFCTLRMEPVFMALGHAAGLASVQAMRANQAVQQIDIPTLQARLREQNAVIQLPPVKK